MKRFLVFSSRTRSNHLCVCMARDRRHALAVARQLFTLKRTPTPSRRRRHEPLP
jgi:hypothetical protein